MTRRWAIGLVLLAVMTAACGDSSDEAGTVSPAGETTSIVPPNEVDATTSTAPPTTAGLSSDTTAAPIEATVLRIDIGTAVLGDVLTDGSGHTIYGFTDDDAGAPTCIGDCLKVWPAVLVEGSLEAGEGVDADLLSLVPNPEGLTQLAVDGQPAYYFIGDAVAGDISGHGTNGAWFVFNTDGTLLTPKF
jgi:predicted lipoprotein with Yx(FWY)xxD motif